MKKWITRLAFGSWCGWRTPKGLGAVQRGLRLAGAQEIAQSQRAHPHAHAAQQLATGEEKVFETATSPVAERFSCGRLPSSSR
jgi:hypothetical protein